MVASLSEQMLADPRSGIVTNWRRATPAGAGSAVAKV